MKASDLKSTNKEMRTYIISQAELRLDGQMQFAAAADQRSAMVSGAAIALATVSFAAAAQVVTNEKILSGIATVIGLGFASAAWFAIQSAICQDFHPGGYYPKNFVSDIRSRKTMAQVQAEIAEDLDGRLDFNSGVLSRRGRQISVALKIMFVTPFVGIVLFSSINYGPGTMAAIQNWLTTTKVPKSVAQSWLPLPEAARRKQDVATPNRPSTTSVKTKKHNEQATPAIAVAKPVSGHQP